MVNRKMGNGEWEIENGTWEIENSLGESVNL
jgi:hypothetical protein